MRSTGLARYRLRFLLQEIDLPQGDTLIGRSASCHVTIEDPLVSRQHARLRIEGERAFVEDLGSRNGLMVNAHPIDGRHELSEGDRIRIGTQELVFCTVQVTPSRSSAIGTRPTGFMCHCAACGLPYPAEMVQCPSCGSSERSDEDTISGVVGESQRNWTLELLVEVMSKAHSLKRWEDLERMLRRARANIDERLAAGEPLDRASVDAVADAAGDLAAHRADAEWGLWVLDVYSQLGRVPPASASEHLSTLPPAVRAGLAPAAGKVVASVRAAGGPTSEDQDGFSKVESLVAEQGSGDAR